MTLHRLLRSYRAPRQTKVAGLVAFVLVLLVLFPLGARASTFSLYQMNADGSWRSTAGSSIIAQGFSTHSTGGFLNSVRVRIRNATENNSSSSGASTFSVSLWSSIGGLPLAKLADLVSNQSIGAWGDGDFTFTPVGDINLGTAPAIYFVVVAGSAGGTIGWKCNAASPTADEIALNYPRAISSNNGSSWSSLSSGTCSGSYFNLTVTATDVSSTTSSSVASTTSSSSTSSTTALPTTTSTTAVFSPSTSLVTPVPKASTSTQPTALVPVRSTTTNPKEVVTTTTTPQNFASDVQKSFKNSNGFFGDDFPSPIVIRAVTGMEARSVRIVIQATELVPGSEVVLTMYSDPSVLLRETVPSDGNFYSEVKLTNIAPDESHVLVTTVVSKNENLRFVGSISFDESIRVIDVIQPSVVSEEIGPDANSVKRSQTSGYQIYDAGVQPSTGSLAVTTAAILSLVAAGVTTAGSSVVRQREAKGKLAGFVTKKLKAVPIDQVARGDSSSTWRMPLTRQSDAFSSRIPNLFGTVSAVLPRIAVDGAWLRAVFGSFGFAPWIVAFIAGLQNGFSLDSVVAPTIMTVIAFACLGLLDSGAGMSAWLGTVIGAIATGAISDWYDVRTLLGLAVLYTGLAPLAHVIRPLRRDLSIREDAIERLFDYLITPIFLAFAGGGMVKALNGLSALKLMSSSDVTRAMWFFGVFIVLRFVGEDFVRALYPQRMASVQPQKLTSPSRSLALLAVIPRSAVILFVAVPFFGLTWKTILSIGLLAIPTLMKPFEDDLPNSAFIHRWLPRGLFRFVCLLIIGAWMSSLLVPQDSPTAVRDAAVWMLLPGVLVGVLEGFGRQDGNWSNTPRKWVLGVGVWLLGSGIVTGVLTFF